MGARRESAAADLQDGLDDDRDDHRFEPGQRARDSCNIAVGRIDVGEREQDEDRRDDKEGSGDNAAQGPMQQPAYINGELLSLRAGQQHAVVERMQKSLFTQPAPPLDQLTVHDRDLTGRAAEGDEPQLYPEPKRLREGDAPPCGTEVTFARLAGFAWPRDF